MPPGSKLGLLLSIGSAACVPEGPPSSATGNGEITLEEETIELPSAGPEGSEDIGAGFSDDFERDEIGPDYEALSDVWRITQGWLCGKGAKNRGVWLARKLPTNVRIEFDAAALSDEGDIKVELFGDGRSGATQASYVDATGYIAIFGGWTNTFHVLARQNEHGTDRKEIRVDSANEDPLGRPVQQGQSYHFKFERKRGNMITWSVNGAVMLEHTDPAPLVGRGHEHFGFNDWTAPVCFDNLEIEPL